MKKIKISDLLLIGGVILVLVIAIFAVGSPKEESAVELPVILEGEAGVKEISYNDYEELVDSEKAFLVVIAKQGCSYCEMYAPILEEVAKDEEILINYIDLTTFSEEEVNELTTNNAYLKKNNWGTPTTLLMVGEEVIDSLSGYTEKDGVIKFLEKSVDLDAEVVEEETTEETDLEEESE